MSDTRRSGGEPIAERANRRLYAGVVAAEAFVLLAMWLVQRYFGP